MKDNDTNASEVVVDEKETLFFATKILVLARAERSKRLSIRDLFQAQLENFYGCSDVDVTQALRDRIKVRRTTEAS